MVEPRAETVFRVELLPARHGDSVLIEYGAPGDVHRVMVDCGPSSAYGAVSSRLAQLPRLERKLDLLVLTHVDGDHIQGALKLLSDEELGVDVRQVWFNAYSHLPSDDLGPVQGELLSMLIRQRGIPWNTSFHGAAVKRSEVGDLPAVTLAGGMTLTVLAPADRELRALRARWRAECVRAGIRPGVAPAESSDPLRRADAADTYLGVRPDVPALARVPERYPDTSPANASSIVLLAEYAGRRVLLAGDSTPAALVAGLERLRNERGCDTFSLDAFKLPHHGSRHNVVAEVLRLTRSKSYLVSSDGSYYGHPDVVAIARAIRHGPPGARLVFNYRCAGTQIWGDAQLHRDHDFCCLLPPLSNSGMGISLV